MYKYRIRVDPNGEKPVFIPQYGTWFGHWENMYPCNSEQEALQEIAKFRKEQEGFEKRMEALREKENKVRYIPVD